jgi:SprT protein
MTNFEFMEAANNKTRECWYKLVSKYNRSIPLPTVSFDLRGGAAGEAKGGRQMRLNMGFVAKYAEDMINQTVPHEVAHLWLYAVGDPSHVRSYEDSVSSFYSGRRARRSPHGDTFMRTLAFLGGETKRTHSYDVSEVKKGFKYSCGCPGRVFVLSTRKHNIIKSGRRCWCKKCGADLIRMAD